MLLYLHISSMVNSFLQYISIIFFLTSSLIPSLGFLHLGHHVPCLIESGTASQVCPLLQSHYNFILALIYSIDKHFPPLLSASSCICSIVIFLFLLQVGHQCPALTLPGIAFHLCPSAHSHNIFSSHLYSSFDYL